MAEATGLSDSTVNCVLARAVVSPSRPNTPAQPVVRYDQAASGDLLHIDIKKWKRITRPGRQAVGSHHDIVDSVG